MNLFCCTYLALYYCDIVPVLNLWSACQESKCKPSKIWEKHFKSMFMEQGKPVSNIASNIRFQLLILWQWKPVLEEEIVGLISKIKSGKASASDNIATELKQNLDWWSSLLAALLASIHISGLIPSGWNRAMISKILPIRLLLDLEKLYARHLNGQLTFYLEGHFVLTKAQTAFRKGRSFGWSVFYISLFSKKIFYFLERI